MNDREREQRRAACRRYYQRHKEKVLAQAKVHYLATADTAKAKQKARRMADPERARQIGRKHKSSVKSRDTYLKRNYGITFADKTTLYKSQLGRCAICTEFLPPVELAPTDHCHVTGKVRGLLCDRCNQGLGRFRDKIELLQSAIVYLEGSLL